jgi:two-component system sensor histidine kinase PilS (NtrC family)
VLSRVVTAAPVTIPKTRALLRFVYLGRVSVAAAVFLAVALRFRAATRVDVLLAALVLVAAAAVTLASFWHTHVRDRAPDRAFLYAQAAFDTALITVIVHLTGGPQSDFAGLYVLLVAVTAVLMPVTATALVTVVVGAAYLGDVLIGYPGTSLQSTTIQLVVFGLVAAVTAYLATRVSLMGAEREALAGELRQARLEAAEVLRQLRSGVITVDGDGRLLFSNPAADDLLGFPVSSFAGRPLLDHLGRVAPEFAAAVAAAPDWSARQQRVEAEVRLGDRSFPIGVTVTRHVRDADSGGSVRITAIFTDISATKRIEQLRLRAERLEGIAELSASLAHEIKNPLASIRSSVEQLARASRSHPDEQFLAGLIVRESDRLSRLLTEFLDFSRVRVTQYRSVDLAQIADAAIRLVRRHPECPADAVIELHGGAAMVDGDEDLLHRVVWNLVLNAVQAAGPDARVTVRLCRPSADQLPGGVTIDGPVMLTVSDNGPGIPDAVRGRLFQPFVSGRPGGSGLGLAIVQRAVEAHRGVVLLESAPGQGTTFTIYFPATGRGEEAP